MLSAPPAFVLSQDQTLSFITRSKQPESHPTRLAKSRPAHHILATSQPPNPPRSPGAKTEIHLRLQKDAHNDTPPPAHPPTYHDVKRARPCATRDTSVARSFRTCEQPPNCGGHQGSPPTLVSDRRAYTNAIDAMQATFCGGTVCRTCPHLAALGGASERIMMAGDNPAATPLTGLVA